MVLFLHNRYRTAGGEERVVEDLAALVRERLGESVEVLSRDSASTSSALFGTGVRASSCAEIEPRKANEKRAAARIDRNMSPPGSIDTPNAKTWASGEKEAVLRL